MAKRTSRLRRVLVRLRLYETAQCNLKRPPSFIRSGNFHAPWNGPQSVAVGERRRRRRSVGGGGCCGWFDAVIVGGALVLWTRHKYDRSMVARPLARRNATPVNFAWSTKRLGYRSRTQHCAISSSSDQHMKSLHYIRNYLWWLGVVVSELASINEVNQRRARLVMRWVTVSGFSSRCGTFISVFGQPPRSTQLGHPFVGRRNEYQPKGGDALRLGSKGRYGSCVGGR